MEFRVGERVKHPKFGAGLVLAVTGAGDARAYRVSFDGDGQQRLLLARLAHLEAGENPVKRPPARKGAA